jgi:hypothetical protein
VSIPVYISFDDGVVCRAFNEESWTDPTVQLRERVLNYGRGASLIDGDINVIQKMSHYEAVVQSGKPADF